MAAQELIFREDDHSYWLRGRRIPSVSQVVSILSDFADINREALQFAADRGTAVHTATEYYDAGSLDLESIDPRIIGYVEAWIDFRISTGFDPASIEQMVCHDQLQYAGRLDRIGWMRNAAIPFIIDIKSGPVKPWHGVQLAGYAGCLNGIYRRAVVQLLPSGKFKMHEFTDRSDWKLFKACLSVWNAQQEFKAKEKENESSSYSVA